MVLHVEAAADGRPARFAVLGRSASQTKVTTGEDIGIPDLAAGLTGPTRPAWDLGLGPIYHEVTLPYLDHRVVCHPCAPDPAL